MTRIKRTAQLCEIEGVCQAMYLPRPIYEAMQDLKLRWSLFVVLRPHGEDMNEEVGLLQAVGKSWKRATSVLEEGFGRSVPITNIKKHRVLMDPTYSQAQSSPQSCLAAFFRFFRD